MKKMLLFVIILFSLLQGCNTTGNVDKKGGTVITYKIESPDKGQAVTDEEIAKTNDVLLKRIKFAFNTYAEIEEKQNGTFQLKIPGVFTTEKEKLEHLLSLKSDLEFWCTYESREIIPLLEDVNKIVKALKDENAGKDKKEEAEIDSSQIGLTEQMALMDQPKTADEWKAEYPFYNIFQPNIRVDENGTASFAAPRQPVIGTASVEDTSEVNSYFNMLEVKAIMPEDVRWAWTAKSIDVPGEKEFFQLVALKLNCNTNGGFLTQDYLSSARADISAEGENQVALTFNEEGAAIFQKLTRENIGKSIAILLNGKVYSYPIVQSEIPGGKALITANFSKDEARTLTGILNSGSSPCDINILSHQVVSPEK